MRYIYLNFQTNLPKPLTVGVQLTLDAYRWDQRVFAQVLRFPGVFDDGASHRYDAASDRKYEPNNALLQSICIKTGGIGVYCILSLSFRLSFFASSGHNIENSSLCLCSDRTYHFHCPSYLYL